MTVETAFPQVVYTIAGTGPYALLWPYAEDEVVVRAGSGDALTTLARTYPGGAAQLTFAPTASETSGNLYLSIEAAAAYAGQTLIVTRDSQIEQGWQSVSGGREAGLMAAMDRLARIAQELAAAQDASLRFAASPVPPIFPLRDGTLIIAEGVPSVGPVIPSVDLLERALAAASVLAGLGENLVQFVTGNGTVGPYDLPVAPSRADWLTFYDRIEMDPDEWRLVPSLTALSGFAVIFTEPKILGRKYKYKFTRPVSYDPALVNLVVEEFSGTSYTATVADLGKWKRSTSTSAVTVTLPNDLPVGWACHWEQGGTGQITFVAASGATLTNDQTLSKTFARYSVATAAVTTNTTGTAAQYNLSGALSA